MFNSNGGYSLADIAAATGNDRNGNGNGMWNDGGAWWIIILFLFVFCGWGGNGFGGGFGNNGTAGGVMDAYVLNSDFATLQRQLDSGFGRLTDNVTTVNEGLCNGFYAMNTGMLNGFSGVQQSLSNGFAGVDNAICTLGYQTQEGINSVNVANMQNTNAIQNSIKDNMFANSQNTNAIQSQLAQCCCENRAAIADVKYTMATDTCSINNTIQNTTRDIIDNQNASTRSILDFLVQDKISTLQAENQGLKLAASQAAQNNYLVSELRPCPIPAYTVPNPFCCNTGYNGCNFGGCGC